MKMTAQCLFLLLAISFTSAAIIPANPTTPFKNNGTSPTHQEEYYNGTETKSSRASDFVQKRSTAYLWSPDADVLVVQGCASDVHAFFIDLKIDGKKFRYAIIKQVIHNKHVPSTTTPKPTTTTTLRPFNPQAEKDVMDPIQKYNQDNDPLNYDRFQGKRDTSVRLNRYNGNGLMFLVRGGPLKNLTAEKETSGSRCGSNLSLDDELFETSAFACLKIKFIHPDQIEYSIIGSVIRKPKVDQHLQELARVLCSEHINPNLSIKKTTTVYKIGPPKMI